VSVLTNMENISNELYNPPSVLNAVEFDTSLNQITSGTGKRANSDATVTRRICSIHELPFSHHDLDVGDFILYRPLTDLQDPHQFKRIKREVSLFVHAATIPVVNCLIMKEYCQYISGWGAVWNLDKEDQIQKHMIEYAMKWKIGGFNSTPPNQRILSSTNAAFASNVHQPEEREIVTFVRGKRMVKNMWVCKRNETDFSGGDSLFVTLGWSKFVSNQRVSFQINRNKVETERLPEYRDEHKVPQFAFEYQTLSDEIDKGFGVFEDDMGSNKLCYLVAHCVQNLRRSKMSKRDTTSVSVNIYS
jgi:hypothetical protein